MKLLELLKKRAQELRDRINTSNDAAEIRSMGDELNATMEEIRALEDQQKDPQQRGEKGEPDQQQRTSVPDIPDNAQFRNGLVASFNQTPQRRNEDPTDTIEYRTAFMNYVCRNVPIPAELRENQVTTTADASAVIPKTILNEIVKKMSTYGNIFAKVRKLNVKGGVSIPVLTLKPEAKWIGETTPSDTQKIKADEKVTFTYFGVECKIAQSLLENITTLDIFQEQFVELATEAIVKAVEIAIFNGNGTTQPTGILKDSRVPSENVITMTPEEFSSWDGWHKKVKAKMKKAYRDGEFIMAQGTFDGHIDGMTDKNGQPIGRINYGMNGEENYRFMGKNVETVEDECIASWDDANTGDVIAVFAKLSDYGVNTNMQMTTVKWVDNDNNELKNKCIMALDGKLIDPNGVLIIKKGESAAKETHTLSA